MGESVRKSVMAISLLDRKGEDQNTSFWWKEPSFPVFLNGSMSPVDRADSQRLVHADCGI
jgi:hypothetical protein